MALAALTAACMDVSYQLVLVWVLQCTHGAVELHAVCSPSQKAVHLFQEFVLNPALT